MRERRAAAAARVGAGTKPTTAEEVWRYSRIDDLDLDSFTIEGGDASTTVDLPASWTEAGVTIRRAADVGPGDGLGDLAGDDTDLFGALNDAFCVDPLVIDVPRGANLTDPLVVTQHVSGDRRAFLPRLVLRVGEGASASLVERSTSGEGTVLLVPVTELSVARGGRLDAAFVQDLGPAAWQIATLITEVAQEATLRVGLVGLGGDYARTRTDCRLAGRGAHGELLAAYFGDGDQTLDYRTFQHHDAPDTSSNLLFKGAVGGRSRSVYTGLIRVGPEARGTNAFQTNRNVKLSEDAWAESVPNLEIETNDVRCSHASTVGPVDPEQRFYLESRGVPPQVADRLIVAGFFDEVVRDLPAGISDGVRSAVADKLDRVSEDLR